MQVSYLCTGYFVCFRATLQRLTMVFGYTSRNELRTWDTTSIRKGKWGSAVASSRPHQPGCLFKRASANANQPYHNSLSGAQEVACTFLRQMLASCTRLSAHFKPDWRRQCYGKAAFCLFEICCRNRWRSLRWSAEPPVLRIRCAQVSVTR